MTQHKLVKPSGDVLAGRNPFPSHCCFARCLACNDYLLARQIIENGSLVIFSETCFFAPRLLRGRVCPTVDIFSLGRALLLKNPEGAPDTCIVASDDSDGISSVAKATQPIHTLSCFDVSMKEQDPLRGWATTSDVVRDLHMMHDDLVVVGLGNGLIETYEVVRDDGVVELIQEDSFSLHTHDDGSAASVIRLAVNPVNAHVASSSTDQRISVVDAINGFDSGAVIMRQSMGDLVPALSWDRGNTSVLHAIWGSENPCSFLMLDERAGLDPTKAAFSYHSGRYNMFSMKQYSEYGVLLGFEGGEIRHIDVRTGNRCDLVFYDPYVPAIAGFEFSPDGKSFVTSGLTDFTMWSMDNSLRAHVVAHSGGVSNRVSGETGYMVHASFLDDNTILSTDSEGFINRFSIGSDAV